jgi:hypothetical protein
MDRVDHVRLCFFDNAAFSFYREGTFRNKEINKDTFLIGGFKDIATLTKGLHDLFHRPEEVAAGGAAIGTGYGLMLIGGYLVISSPGTGLAAPVVAYAGGVTFVGGAVLVGFGSNFVIEALSGH